MGGGKGSAPAAPDYSQLINADIAQSTQDFQLQQQQMGWAQQQWNTVWPYAQQYLQQQIQSSQLQSQQAQEAQKVYNRTFLPMEKQFASTAANYNSPAQSAVQAGAAEADVASAFNQQRQTAQQQLESYGIDPSQTRYQALDLSTNIAQAAATAAAGTQSRLNTQATGLALQGEAVNMGQGIQNNVAQSYSTAINAGLGGLGGANSTTSTGGSTMGTPTAYAGLGTAAIAGAGALTNMQYQNQYSSAALNAQEGMNTMSGIGGLIGGGLGLLAAPSSSVIGRLI